MQAPDALRGCRVVVTRPAAQSAALADPPTVTETDRSVNVSWAESAGLLADRLNAVVRSARDTPAGREVTPAPAAFH